MNPKTQEKANAWEVAKPLLDAMYREFKDLSSKKADAAVSKPKITAVNRLLNKCRVALEDEESMEFLDLLDVDSVPQNSDVILILSQYVAAMSQFRSTYYNGMVWEIED